MLSVMVIVMEGLGGGGEVPMIPCFLVAAISSSTAALDGFQ